MRRLTTVLTILATVVAFGSASAAFHNDKLSVNLTAGTLINASTGARNDMFPTAFEATGDLLYQVNSHVSLIPVSMVVHNFSYRQRDNMVTERVVHNLPAQVNTDPEAELNIRGNAWGLGYLPGLRLQSASDNAFNVFGQVGLGVYRFEESYKVFAIHDTGNETDFASRVAAGVDYRLNDRTNVQLSSGYFYTNTDQARDRMVDFNVGAKYMF